MRYTSFVANEVKTSLVPWPWESRQGWSSGVRQHPFTQTQSYVILFLLLLFIHVCQDIVNIARILCIPGLTDGEGRAFVNAHQVKIKASQNSLGANCQHALLELEKAFRTGKANESSDPMSKVKALRYNMVRDLQRIMGYCIIR